MELRNDSAVVERKRRIKAALQQEKKLDYDTASQRYEQLKRIATEKQRALEPKTKELMGRSIIIS
jgi:hypothetical protein